MIHMNNPASEYASIYSLLKMLADAHPGCRAFQAGMVMGAAIYGIKYRGGDGCDIDRLAALVHALRFDEPMSGAK